MVSGMGYSFERVVYVLAEAFLIMLLFHFRGFGSVSLYAPDAHAPWQAIVAGGTGSSEYSLGSRRGTHEDIKGITVVERFFTLWLAHFSLLISISLMSIPSSYLPTCLVPFEARDRNFERLMAETPIAPTP